MRVAQAILGVLIAALVFAAVGSLVYGAAIFLLAQHDGSVFRALQAGDFLAAFRDWSGHAQNHPRNSAAVIGCGAGLVAALAFAVLAIGRPPRGAAFQTHGSLSTGGFFKSNSLFLGRAGGISIEWPRWHYDPVTKTRELRPWRKLVGGRYVHSPYFGHVLVTGPTRSGKGAAYMGTGRHRSHRRLRPSAYGGRRRPPRAWESVQHAPKPRKIWRPVPFPVALGLQRSI